MPKIHRRDKRKPPPTAVARPRSDGTSAYRPVSRYPYGTVVWTGPDNTRATRVTVGVIRDRFGEVAPIESWTTEAEVADMRDDPGTLARVDAFFAPYNVSVVANDRRITGCPHLEGEDYPRGLDCPRCPYWRQRDKWTGERRVRSEQLDHDILGDYGEDFTMDAEDPWADPYFPSYDPERQLQPAEWLSLEEEDRVGTIRTWHRRKGIALRTPLGHSTTHAVMEEQIATGNALTVPTIERLQREGLTRHQAIHSVGEVLRRRVLTAIGGAERLDENGADPVAALAADLNALTADECLAQEAGGGD